VATFIGPVTVFRTVLPEENVPAKKWGEVIPPADKIHAKYVNWLLEEIKELKISVEWNVGYTCNMNL
jgi:hypothetical protein